MLTKRIGILVAAALLALASLPAGAQAQTRLANTSEDPYFPLHVGNQWSYVRTSSVDRQEWRAAVTERILAPNGRLYFSIAGYFGPARWVRSTLRSTVSELSRSSNTDNLWYMLGAAAGTSWVLQLEPLPILSPIADCISGSRAILASRNDVVQVPAGEFRNVVRVDYRSPCADAGLASEWFAPGVGLIKRAEQSFAGPVVSELVRAEIGGIALPRPPYSSSIQLDRPIYVHNLMPPLGPGSIAAARGAYVLSNRTDIPIELSFSGCKSVSVEVLDETGEAVLKTTGNDGGCCACDNIFTIRLAGDAVAIPFAFRLATPDGRPLADGRYTVRATLEVAGARLRPSATAVIEVKSVH